jgi:hypothetical protein
MIQPSRQPVDQSSYHYGHVAVEFLREQTSIALLCRPNWFRATRTSSDIFLVLQRGHRQKEILVCSPVHSILRDTQTLCVIAVSPRENNSFIF